MMDEKNTNKKDYDWKKSFGNTSLQYFIIYFFLFIIITVTGVISVIILNVRKNYYSTNEFYLNDIVGSIQSDIINEFEYLEWHLYNAATEIASCKEQEGDEIIKRILDSSIRNSFLDLVLFCDINGNYIASDNTTQYKSEIIHKIIHGEKKLLFLNDKSALFYLPVKSDNEVLGSICGLLSLDSFVKIINDLRSYSTLGVNILLLNDQTPVVISDVNGDITTNYSINIYSDDVDGIINIRDLVRYQDSGNGLVNVNDKNVFVSFVTIPNSNIKIVTAIPSPKQGTDIDFSFVTLLLLGIFSFIIFFSFIVVIFRSSKKRIRKMTEIAYFDQITNGLNNAGLFYQAPQVINKEEEYAFVQLSIRDFSAYTNIFGSLEGNSILKCVLQVIDSRLGKDELIARAYAENFILLMKRGDKELFEKRIDFFSTCAEAIYNENMAQAYKINLSFACGVYFLKKDDLSDLISLSEKVRLVHDVANIDDRQGNIIEYYDDMLLSKIHEEKEYIDNFHYALENRDFLLYYQPKVDCVTHKILGAEALVRMRSGSKILSPVRFIPVYEKNGYIIQLDLYVFEEVCAAIRNLIVLGEKVVPISVNLSARHFAHPGLADNLERIRASYSIPASLLEIEVTEGVFFDKKAIEIVQKEFTKLHEYGFICSLDDFGSGYSSLSLLMDFDIDFLKIDKSFIDNIYNEKTKIILKSIIDLALSLNIGLIAEGVEKEDQLEIVHNMGCNIIQGYYYSKPLAFDEWVKYHKSFGGDCPKSKS